MSVEIRFKNGMPLMVGGGLIAGSQKCCCENPPPERCWVGGFCSYFIEVVEPSQLAVKTAPIDCNVGTASDTVFSSPWFLPTTIVPLREVGGTTPVGSSFSQVLSSAGQLLMEARVFGAIQGFVAEPHPRADGYSFSASTSAEVRVDYGYETGTGFPFISARITVGAEASFKGFGLPDPFLTGDLYSRGYIATFKLPATCFVSPQRECQPDDVRLLRIDTPLEITINGDGTSSLGSLGAAVEGFPLFGDYSIAEDAVEEMLDTSYTFRITARPSCRSVPADCDVALQGNRIIYFGTATDRDFVLGTPKSTTTGPISGSVTVNYEHYGGAAGTTADPWVFNAKIVRDSDNKTIEEHNVELFCALDDSVSPSVSRWYVREFTYCTPEFGQQTTGQWISVVESYTASNECNGISVGDPVPTGSPDYEEVDGYPVVDFGDPCVPPAPIGLEITDLCP